MSEAKVTITGDETIGEMVQQHPKSAGVMLKYGLHCVGCHVNQYESVKQGAMGHGMPEDMVEKMIGEINDVLNKTIETIEVTPNACEMIKAYAQEDGKENCGLRITVQDDHGSFQYDMEFVETPQEGDEQFEFDSIKVFVGKESYPLLKGSEIDFVETLTESGFRIDNPNVKKGCGCGSGGCGCGGSSGGCGCSH